MGLIAGSKMDPYLNIPLVSTWESEEVLDTAFLRGRYEMEFWNHLGDAKYQDFRMVEIGKTARHDYSERLYLYDSIAGAGGDMLTVEQETVYPAEWILLPDGRVRCRFRLVKLLPILQYEEKRGNLEWHLVQETDSIAGYVCQKAETEYRGREYEAWYCPAIPVDGGPYVFGGLPGLIIRVVDKRGIIHGRCGVWKKAAGLSLKGRLSCKRCLRSRRGNKSNGCMPTLAAYGSPWAIG